MIRAPVGSLPGVDLSSSLTCWIRKATGATMWLVVVFVVMMSSSTHSGQAEAFYLPAADFYCHPEDVCTCEVCPEPGADILHCLENVCPTCPECFASDKFQELLLQTFFYWAATFEVLGRGFALGFGLRMLKYILWEDNAVGVDTSATNEGAEGSAARTSPLDDDEKVLRSLPTRCKISAAAGLSMAALMFGLSVFLPTKVRSRWYQYDSW